MTLNDSRWKAIQQRDASQDANFLYGVVTTGIYCKPSCCSRQPLQANVLYFEDGLAARNAGLRPCLRCKPEQPAEASTAMLAVQKACRILEATPEDALRCEDLAARVGMSASHFHRTFKRVTGSSPAQYRKRLRVDHLKQELKQGHAVTESVYASGFGSSSRVYEKCGVELGMTPGQYRRGGNGIRISYVAFASPIGTMMLGATERGLCFLQFAETAEQLLQMLRMEYPAAHLHPVNAPYSPELLVWMDAIGCYLRGASDSLMLPIDVRGTAFQLRVWQYLQALPKGEVRSYSQIAVDLGSPRGSRAVAGACAANRVALVIPCHRVLRNNGELGGFRWGLERKQKLLEMECGGPSRLIAASG